MKKKIFDKGVWLEKIDDELLTEVVYEALVGNINLKFKHYRKVGGKAKYRIKQNTNHTLEDDYMMFLLKNANKNE